MTSLRFLVSVVLLGGFLGDFCISQNFDSKVSDKDYLDRIQVELRREVVESHAVLVNQTKVLQHVTKSFIETKIKENLFRAVRASIEMELEEMIKNNVTLPRREARQDDDDEEESSSSTTARPRPGLLPQLANVVTTLFGSDVNVTAYVKDSTAFLPQDLQNRFIQAASLIDPNRFTSTSTLPPFLINGQLVPQEAILNGTAYNYLNGNYSGFSYPTNNIGGLNVGQQQGGLGVNANGVSGQPQQGFQQQQQQQQLNQLPNFGVQQQPQQQQTLALVSNTAGFQLPGQGQLNVNRAQFTPNVVNNQVGQQPQFSVGQQALLQQQLQQVSITGQNFLPQQHQYQQPFQQQNLVQNQNFVQQQPQQQQLQQQQQNQFQNQNYIPLQQQQQQQQQLNNNLQLSASNPDSVSNIFNGITPRPFRLTSTPASSNENDEDNNSSGEEDIGNEAESPFSFGGGEEFSEIADDLPVPREDLKTAKANKTKESTTPSPPMSGLLNEYPAIKYAFGLLNRLTRSEVPTTTEFMNTTARTFDSFEEEDMAVTTLAPSTVSRLVQGGVYIYEGAREAYMLLQHVNKFLDRVNERFENAGYGAEEVGINVVD